MSQTSSWGDKRRHRFARKMPLAFLGVALVASLLGIATAASSYATCYDANNTPYSNGNSRCVATPTATPTPVAPPGPIIHFPPNSDGYSASSRVYVPTSGQSTEPCLTKPLQACTQNGAPVVGAGAPAPAAAPSRTPVRRPPARSAKKPVATVKKAACTETTVALPKGIAFVGTKTLHTHCLHMKHDAPIFAVSQDQFNDVKLNLSTLPQTDTAKAGSFSFVCGMEKTHGNSMDIWVLAKGVKGNYGWVNSQQLVETDPKTGATPGLWMCLAAP